MSLKDFETDKMITSKRPSKYFVDLLLRFSTIIFFGLLFIYKDSIQSATSASKYIYAASLVLFFFSSIIGFYNLRRIELNQVFLMDERNEEVNYSIEKRYLKNKRYLRFGIILQFNLFSYGFLSALILALKWLCPLWPFC